MKSQLLERRGAQRPRLSHIPEGRVATSGGEVADFAAASGLILDDWQRWVLDHALAERADGNWCASEVGLIVGRQNGKGSILEALELAALFLLELDLTVHSAHEYKTAGEHYLRLAGLIQGCDLDKRVAHYYTANGNRAIVTKNGSRLVFAARSGGSARGFTGDLIVLDEAYKLTDAAMGAMGPTLLTRRGRQTWYTSSAPHVDSEVLHRVRKRGIEGSPRLFYAEWGNEPGADPHDWDAIAAANPGFGVRIQQDAFEEALEQLGEVEFTRECLGVPSMPDGGSTIFGPGNWQQCEDISSQIHQPDKARLALDVAPNSESASFAVCGARVDGLPHIELIEKGEGTGWVVNRALEYRDYWPIHVLPSPHPVSGLKADLEEAGVELVELPAGAFPQACAAIQRRVIEHELRQIGQGPLNNAVNGAATRVSGEGWTFTRVPSGADISPLVACTVALWAQTQASPAPVELVVI